MTRPDAPRPQADRDFGDYRLLHELGRGGMGTVYVAMQRPLQRAVALKVLSPAVVGERSLWRFQREAQLLAELEHPGIVKVLEAGVANGQPFFAMELVPGASLAVVLRELAAAGLPRGASIRATVQERAADAAPAPADPAAPAWRLPGEHVAAMATILAEVAEAIASAHAAGVVHRDVKPSNILIRRDGAVRVADFGIAHRADAATLTLSGDLAGTPSYMAPEQLRGEPVDHRADVFALGVVLYEALTLQLPFAGQTVAARLAAIDDAVIPARRRAPAIGRDLAAVLDQALAPLPADRYQTAGELAADLRAAVAGRPVRARRPGAWESLWRHARRRPWLVTAAVVATTALATIAAIDHSGRRQVHAESERAAAALAELGRLTVGVRLEAATAAAGAFQVARFEDVPAMERWLAEQGQPLAAELPRLAELLAGIRRDALPYDDAERAADRATHPAGEVLRRIDLELEFLDAQLAQAPTLASALERRPLVVQARTQHEQLLLAGRTWRLPTAERQFLHDQVAALVARLRAFASGPDATLQHVAAQRDWARQSHQRTVVAAAAQWQSVAADLAADARFPGLRLGPQRDLLPLQKDPRSGLWEFVHLRSGTADREVPAPGAGGVVPTPDTGIVLVLLPGGTFAMGAQSSAPDGANHDPEARPEEGPVRMQTLPPFFCGKYEVTAEQWARLALADNTEAAVADRHTRSLRHLAPLLPVDTVSHRRARGILAHHGLALPTEAQWEYACRAGTTTPLPFGSREQAHAFANFADASSRRNGTPTPDADLDDGFARQAPIGSFAPNGFGLHDTLGNQSELIEELSNGRLGLRLPGDQVRRSRFDDTMSMSRGGSYLSPVVFLRASARRDLVGQDQAQQNLGLRVVRAVDP